MFAKRKLLLFIFFTFLFLTLTTTRVFADDHTNNDLPTDEINSINQLLDKQLAGNSVITNDVSHEFIKNGAFDNNLNYWSHFHFDKNAAGQPAKTLGTEKSTNQNCDSGNCAVLQHNDSASQRIYQNIGILTPGGIYKVSAKFKTTSTHEGSLVLYDPLWNRSCNKTNKGRAFADTQTGNDAWQILQKTVQIPLVDNCNESTIKHVWYVLLNGHRPVTDNSLVYYDTVSLKQQTSFTNLEETLNWQTKCQSMQDKYPVVNCPSATVNHNNLEKVTGAYSFDIKGRNDMQHTLSASVPVQPNKLYKVSLSLKITDRHTYSYLDLPIKYPIDAMSDDTLNATKGIWSGRYNITIKNSSLIDQAGWGSGNWEEQNVNWFNESTYFQTTDKDTSVPIRIQLIGFWGNISIDNFKIEEVNSFIDDEYFLRNPITSTYRKIAIRKVQQNPNWDIRTNSGHFVFDDNTITLSHASDADPTEKKVGTITFDKLADGSSFLKDLKQISYDPHALDNPNHYDTRGTVVLKNKNVLLSIAADSTVLTKLYRDTKVTVQGIPANKGGIKAAYSNFEAGVVFSTDYKKGLLFSQLRTPIDISSMPYARDPVHASWRYPETLMSSRGFKNWETNDFTENELRSVATKDDWKITYSLKSGAGFVSQVFPPKDFDNEYKKAYCTQDAFSASPNFVSLPVTKDYSYDYDLQKFKGRANIMLLWNNVYMDVDNRLNPPTTYCLNYNKATPDSKPAYSYTPISCKKPHDAETRVGTKSGFTGPYRVANRGVLLNFVKKAHAQGVKVIIYTYPPGYYTSDVNTFINNLKTMIDLNGNGVDDKDDLDGFYLDGEMGYGEALKNMQLTRQLRNVFPDKFYIQHMSRNWSLIYYSNHFIAPFELDFADLNWNGEGVTFTTEDDWRLYSGQNITNTIGLPLPQMRPVDYTKPSSESDKLTMSFNQQIDKMLQYWGKFSVYIYTKLAFIRDRRTKTTVLADDDYYWRKKAAQCLPISCGDNVCQPGETILSCAKDCAPISTADTVTKQTNNVYTCNTQSSSESVAQWLQNGSPFYLMHYTFDSNIGTDVSGYKNDPSERNNVVYYAPQKKAEAGALYFDGKSTLYGEHNEKLDLTDKNFSLMARVKQDSGDNNIKQVIFSFNGGRSGGSYFYYGLDEKNRVFVTYTDKDNQTQTVTSNDSVAKDQNWHVIGLVYTKPDSSGKGKIDLYNDTKLMGTYSIDSLAPFRGTFSATAVENNIGYFSIGSINPVLYYIGASTTNPERQLFFKGYMDDLFIGPAIPSGRVKEYQTTQNKSFTSATPATCLIYRNNGFQTATNKY